MKIKRFTFILIVVMFASTVTSCLELLSIASMGELSISKEAQEKEQELSDRIAKYDDVDTFEAGNTDNFTESAKTSGTATIYFAPEFDDKGNALTTRFIQRLVFVELLQIPEEAKQLSDTLYYNLYQFPAGIELNIRLYVLFRGHYTFNKPGYRRRGIFKCPPLEAGKKYKLWFESPPRYDDRKNGGGRLILTYDNNRNKRNTPDNKCLKIQEIPPLW